MATKVTIQPVGKATPAPSPTVPGKVYALPIGTRTPAPGRVSTMPIPTKVGIQPVGTPKPATLPAQPKPPGMANVTLRPPTTPVARKPVSGIVKKPVVKAPAVKKPPTGSINKPVIDPKAPKVPSIDEYLTNDTGYQSQQAAILKALADYQASELAAETNYNNQYALNSRDLNTQLDQSRINQNEDYASRGMLRSGLFGVADSNLLNNYARQQTQLDTSRQAYLQGIQQDMGQYITQQQLAQQQARQEAINRRALGLVGSSSVSAV